MNKTNSEVENAYPIGTLVRFSSQWGIVVGESKVYQGTSHRRKVWNLTTGKEHFVDTRWLTPLKLFNPLNTWSGGRYRT